MDNLLGMDQTENNNKNFRISLESLINYQNFDNDMGRQRALPRN